MIDAHCKAKLAKLVEIEGFNSTEDLIAAVFSDSVSPAICLNEGCDFTCEMEPDQNRAGAMSATPTRWWRRTPTISRTPSTTR